MFSLCTLASGSSGNATLIYNDDSAVLIDAGISAKRITDAMNQIGIQPSELNGICITHSHSDHISGLRVFLKKTTCPVYMTEATAGKLCEQVPGIVSRLSHIYPEEDFPVGSLSVCAHSTPHDAPGSACYTVSFQDRKCAVVTDLGHVPPSIASAVAGSQLVLIEANHDVDWLRSGPYPVRLQDRILGPKGHLSNEACGAFCVELVHTGTERLILGHLSAENNSPIHAGTVVCSILKQHGLGHIPVTIASRDKPSTPFEV